VFRDIICGGLKVRLVVIILPSIRRRFWSLDSNEFLSKSLRITSQETFLAPPLHSKRLAKNPLFEAISSLHGPMGPHKFSFNAANFKANDSVKITGRKKDGSKNS
jgi:hypothetical protein